MVGRLRVEVTPGAPDVFALLKAYRGKYYLLAVNTAPEPAEASFGLVDVPGVAKVSPMFGSKAPARLDAANKVLQVPMDARSTVVYDIAVP